MTTIHDPIIAEAERKIQAWSDEFMAAKARRDADARLQYLLKLTRTVGRPRLSHGTAGGQQVFLSIFADPDHPRWLRACALANARRKQLEGRSGIKDITKAATLRREEQRRRAE